MTRSQLRARYRRIVYFAARVVATLIWCELILPHLGFRGWARRTRPRRNQRFAARFRVLAVNMGGLVIKVGQALSSRVDVLPREVTHELADLQDEVPAETFKAIRTRAEAELGSSLEEHYEWFDETPMAAASLGQVHRARLRPADAHEVGFANVAVKVQRPDIEKIVEVDLTALRTVGRWLQRYRPISDRADVPALIEEFASTTYGEIDYLAEGRNAETFAENFEDNPFVYVPEVVWNLTRRRVLTLEDVSAIKITDYDAITAAGIDRKRVASVLINTYFQQIFEDCFVHADPHPGNIFVTPLPGTSTHGGPEWCLTFVDFGMVGSVPENLRAGLRELLIAIGTQDAARLVEGYRTLGVLLPGADLARIEEASRQVFDRFWGMSMSELRTIEHAEFARFAMQFREVLLEMPFQFPENLLFLGRTVAILSGMCTGLDPEFNVWVEISPYANQLIADEDGFNFEMWMDEGLRILKQLIGMPGRMDRVLSTIERGELSMRTPVLEQRVRRLERSAVRQTSGVVFAALLVAGAVLYPANALLAEGLMGASLVPLAMVVFRGHRRR